MTSRFVRVSWGLQYTDAFLHIDTIKAYIQSFQKDREVDSTTKMKESIAFTAQDRMEEEIFQTIRTSDRLTQEELFEYLTGWIKYFEYQNNTEKLKKLIEDYNEKRLIEYEELIALEEEKFKQSKQYKTLNNLDFYEVDYGWLTKFSAIHRAATAQQRLVQYHKFLEAPDPDLIDIDFLPKYIKLITAIISRCVTIAKKWLTYLKGESELKNLPPPSPKPLAPRVENIKSNRLKVRLTVEQLTILFRLFRECKMIDVKLDKEIHSFIADNFETVGREGKPISAKNVGRLFSKTDTDVMNFWIAKFTELSKKAAQK
jgi:hypothetical protein